MPSIKSSINAAHKQIVIDAYEKGLPEVCIGEDDISFSSAGAWDYFLSQKPKEFDIYLGGIFLGDEGENGIVDDFTGMTLYIVSSRFYETFLSTDPNEHIDRSLAYKGLYYVCKPFVCTQHEGISSNTGKWESYQYLQRNRQFFRGY